MTKHFKGKEEYIYRADHLALKTNDSECAGRDHLEALVQLGVGHGYRFRGSWHGVCGSAAVDELKPVRAGRTE